MIMYQWQPRWLLWRLSGKSLSGMSPLDSLCIRHFIVMTRREGLEIGLVTRLHGSSLSHKINTYIATRKESQQFFELPVKRLLLEIVLSL